MGSIPIASTKEKCPSFDGYFSLVGDRLRSPVKIAPLKNTIFDKSHTNTNRGSFDPEAIFRSSLANFLVQIPIASTKI